MKHQNIHYGIHNNKNVFSLDQGSVGGSLHPWGGKQSVMRLGDRKVFSVPGDPDAEAHYRNLLSMNPENPRAGQL